MSWPQVPPLVLQQNWTIEDNACLVLARRLSIGRGNRMTVGNGSILKIA